MDFAIISKTVSITGKNALKLKTLCFKSIKNSVNRVKKQPNGWEKVFASHIYEIANSFYSF